MAKNGRAEIVRRLAPSRPASRRMDPRTPAYVPGISPFHWARSTGRSERYTGPGAGEEEEEEEGWELVRDCLVTFSSPRRDYNAENG